MVRVTNREVSKASESNKDRDTETKKQRCVERPTGGTDGEKAGGLGWGMTRLRGARSVKNGEEAHVASILNRTTSFLF